MSTLFQPLGTLQPDEPQISIDVSERQSYVAPTMTPSNRRHLAASCIKPPAREENRILRRQLPKRIDVTTAERAKPLKLGVRLGSRIKEVITIVHPRTFARWLSEKTSGVKPCKRGRPRTPDQICELIIEMV